MTFDPVKYNQQKADGTRSPTGALRLSKLRGKHLRIINLHLSGMKAGDIAATLNVTEGWISTVLNDPLARAEIHRRFVDTDREMIAQATNVVQQKMESKDEAIALRAADMVFRAHGRYTPKTDDRPTAEDVVQKMLEIAARTGHASVSVTAGTPPGQSDKHAHDPFILIDVDPAT